MHPKNTDLNEITDYPDYENSQLDENDELPDDLPDESPALIRQDAYVKN
jgi:hypothetical protein